MSLPPFTLAEIEERFDDMFVEVSEAVMQHLTQFDIQTQDALLMIIEKAASTSSGLAFQFANRLQRAIELMEIETIEMWLDQAIDVFDSKGLYGAIEKLDELESVASHAKQKLTGIAFEEVCNMLEHFVTGLNGRKLKIETDKKTYTDTENIFLPGMLNHFVEKDDNFQLYKCTVVFLWAQNWFGTWRCNFNEVFSQFKNPARAQAWFHMLEIIRLDLKIQHELPGIHRQMQRLNELAGHTKISDINISGEVGGVITRNSQSSDCLNLLAQVYHLELPPLNHYCGCLLADKVELRREIRLIKEKELFRQAIAHVLEDKKDKAASELNDEERREISAQQIPDPNMPEGFKYRLELDGEPIEPPDGVESLMSSIIQDLGEIPDDYLVAAGDGNYKATADEEKKSDDTNVWAGTYHEEGAFLHKEWDHRRQRYKKNWCALREVNITSGSTTFVKDTISKYSGIIKNLRRTFEILRGEDKMLKKQPYGDDIDIDALVEAWADSASGMEMSENIFTKMHKEERNIALIFMVDMSGSTKGWINDAERESLVLLSEALEILGDRYAIYGFTGNTRKRCEVYPVKTFDDDYNDEVKGRIANITPQDYTRLGVFIRHFNQMFETVEAKTKILITLSDGKPEDYDGYRGEYGIEDTRMALLESRQQGIHPFCITIDKEGRDYLKTMYGSASYVVIDNVKQLPLKVADIYRNITR
ncbi:Nitric oxide reductase activation protein NorD [hydrothermal vent metagenome]|uniref:Nitric oxide reductase activation protein NorD n=1 Tax=hydrothermal vent metagenome TaxID=652676 RepID=A0A3B0XUN0_9ZZZZ